MKPTITFHSEKLIDADFDKPAKEKADPKPKKLMQRTITVNGGRNYTLFQTGLTKSERIPVQICTADNPDDAKPEDFRDVIQGGNPLTLSPDQNTIRLDMPGVYRLVIPHDAKRKSPLIVGMY